MLYRIYMVTAVCGVVDAGVLRKTASSSSTVPQYYQTTPELFAGAYCLMSNDWPF